MRFMYIKYIQQQSSSSKILSFYATQQILLPKTKVSFWTIQKFSSITSSPRHYQTSNPIYIEFSMEFHLEW